MSRFSLFSFLSLAMLSLSLSGCGSGDIPSTPTGSEIGDFLSENPEFQEVQPGLPELTAEELAELE